MQREPPDRPVGRHTADGGRRCRLVPPAVTPVAATDIGAGVIGHLRGGGRNRFRRAIESYLDAEGSATYTSFRRTLAACLRELRASATADRTAVLIPSFCSSDFADAIDGVGLDPVRYDVDPDSLSLDMSSATEALRDDPLAAVAVNVLGYSSPMSAFATRCAERDVYLVEALGYALGTEYEGDRLGTFGDCAVLNFQQGKPIPVGGGMVVNRNPTLDFDDAGRPAVDANAGVLAGYAAFSRPRPYYAYVRLTGLLEAAGRSPRVTTHPESKLDVAYEPPFATISDFQGAVGLRTLGRLDDHRATRTATAAFYADGLADCPGVQSITPADGLSALQHVRYPVLARTTGLRDRIQAALREAGVQATTLYDWPVVDPDDFPGAARLQRGILTLPTHPYVDDRDRRSIVETVRAVATTDDSTTRPDPVTR